MIRDTFLAERPAAPTALDPYLSVTQRYATQFAQRRRESGPGSALG